MKHVAIASLVLSCAAATLPAVAEDKDLPGVTKPDAIVTTLPPDPSENTDDPRSFRIGNTEVRISGTITIDITAGDLKYPPLR